MHLKQTIQLVAILLTAMSISNAAFAQDTILTRRPLTKIQQFVERTGTVIKQEFTELEPVAGLSAAFVTIEDISLHQKLKGLRFMYGRYRADYFYHQIAFLDSDEIDGFMNFLVFAKALSTKPDVYTEYHFKTRGDLEILVSSHQRNNGALTGDWDYFILVDKNDNAARIQLNKIDFSSFVSIMLKSKYLFSEQ